MANQTIAIELYKKKKLNTSTLNKTVDKRYCYDGFRGFDAILTILLKFSLLVAIPFSVG